MKLFCIADEDTVRGLRLAGVEGRAVVSAEEAHSALDEAVDRADCAVVILTEKVAADLSERVSALRSERERPLFVRIAGPEGPAASGLSLMSLVEQSVGISLNDPKEE